MDIKPIETVYNGYRFRSRLEARWAVFFDAAGIKYQYEPQGFVAEDGTKYLPDFYLPDFDIYCEVKPTRPGAQEELKHALRMIRWGGPIKRLVVLGSIPCGYDGGLWHFPCYYYSAGACYSFAPEVAGGWYFFWEGVSDDGTPICIGSQSGAPYKSPIRWQRESESYTLGMEAVSDTVLRKEINGGKDPNYDYHEAFDLEDDNGNIVAHFPEETIDLFDCNKEGNALVYTSLDKARQARFEHGEHPA